MEFTLDPGILCFHHCGAKYFCFVIPNICPQCKLVLYTETVGRNYECCRTATKIEPFRIPYPFIRASLYGCSIVLRPTSGDFLQEHNNAKNLHIAVTTSTGCVVEFDWNGLQKHSTGNVKEWDQSLLIARVPESWSEHWDQTLLEVSRRWTTSNYHEDTNNCFSFVLTFLQTLGYDDLSKDAQMKNIFCAKYIVPKTTAAAKYISLYRRLRENNYYIQS